MTCSVDTNCVLSWLLPDRNPHQAKLMDQLLNNNSNTVHISDYVFAEIDFILRKQYEFTKEMVAQNINIILDQKTVNANKNMLRRVLPIYTQTSLSFVDCCLIVQAELNNAVPLYTFDKDLVKKSNNLAIELK